MTEKFDAIVIGAGPAGSTAAYVMAKAGLSVLVLERGEYPGAKNTSGAVLYGDILTRLVPDFWQEAPVERWITRHVISFLTGDSSLEMAFKHQQSQKYIGLSVLRSKFDRWLAQKAAEAGALILNSSLAEGLLRKGKSVVGVKVAKERGEVYADIVIVADGANSLMAEQATLRGKSRAQDVGLGVKEVIRLPAQEIERRFALTGTEGAAYSFLGDVTQGLPGGGFLYTNKESISLGLVVNLSSLSNAGVTPGSLLDRFKEHRDIEPLLADGIFKEYSAHLIPESGYDMMPRLYSDGVLVAGDAAGFTVNTGFVLRGIDLAIASGMAAAEAVKRAKKLHDFSAGALSYYRQLLGQSGVLGDLRRYRGLSRFLRSGRLYEQYPEWFCRAAQSLFTVAAAPRDGFVKTLLRTRPKGLSYPRVIVDIFKGARNL